jgi:transcriptional regulator with XRE-family HTH domain
LTCGLTAAEITRIELGADVDPARLRRIAAALQVPNSTFRLAAQNPYALGNEEVGRGWAPREGCRHQPTGWSFHRNSHRQRLSCNCDAAARIARALFSIYQSRERDVLRKIAEGG